MSGVLIGKPANLKGTVKISGAKNAAIPLICAALLAKGKVLLKNVPQIKDIENLLEILRRLDCKVSQKRHRLKIDNTNLKYQPLTFEEVKKMRGSYYLIGVFLTLFSKCEIYLPGGCNIGKRPIDIHLDAFEQLGFSYKIIQDTLFIAKEKELKEVSFRLKNKSVGASLNAIFAALSLSKVTMTNTLFEPEGKDVLTFLQKIGYSIRLCFDELVYEKKPLEFRMISHKMIPDRIEAMTYVVLGLLSGRITVCNVCTEDLELPLELLRTSGYDIVTENKKMIATCSRGSGMNIITEVYPGFPTDLQAIFGVLCAFASTESEITETIFENRFQIYEDLHRVGISVCKENNKILLKPQKFSSDAVVFQAKDLRHGAALCLLGCALFQDVVVENFEYVERGYENFIAKIQSLGGNIERINEKNK